MANGSYPYVPISYCFLWRHGIRKHWHSVATRLVILALYYIYIPWNISAAKWRLFYFRDWRKISFDRQFLCLVTCCIWGMTARLDAFVA